MDYNKKYLKYKIKYLKLKNLFGSGKRKDQDSDSDSQEERRNKLAREEEAAREHYLYNQLLEARSIREREQELNYQFLTPEAQEQIREYEREQEILNSLNNAKNGNELLDIIQNFNSDDIIDKYNSTFNEILGKINNIDLLYKIIKYNYKFILFIQDKFKNDNKFILTYIQNNNNDWNCHLDVSDEQCEKLKKFYEYIPKKLIDNEIFVLELLKINGYFMIYLPDKYKDNKRMALISLKQNGYIYGYLTKYLQADKEIVITALNNGYPFDEIPDKFKEDTKIIITALNNGYPFDEIPDKFKEDEKFILTYIQNNDWNCHLDGFDENCEELQNFYEYIPKNLINNEEFILELLKINGYFMIYLPDKYKDNKAMALIALKQNGYIYSYLSKNLRADKEIFLIAYCKDGGVMGHIISDVPDILSHDIKFIIEAEQLKSYLGNNYNFETTIFMNLYNDGTLHDIYYNNKNNVKLILEYDSGLFEEIPDELQKDKEIVITALNNGYPFEYIPDELKEDKDIVITALNNGFPFDKIPDKFKEKKYKVIFALNNGLPFDEIPDELKEDKDIVITTLNKGLPFDKIPDRLKEDNDILIVKYKINNKKYQSQMDDVSFYTNLSILNAH
jgi:hypothetical protein